MRRSSGTKPMPSLATAWGASPAICRPSQTTSPSDGGVSPISERMVVVLPTPLRPISAMQEPCSTSKETPNSTRDRP